MQSYGVSEKNGLIFIEKHAVQAAVERIVGIHADGRYSITVEGHLSDAGERGRNAYGKDPAAVEYGIGDRRDRAVLDVGGDHHILILVVVVVGGNDHLSVGDPVFHMAVGAVDGGVNFVRERYGVRFRFFLNDLFFRKIYFFLINEIILY